MRFFAYFFFYHNLVNKDLYIYTHALPHWHPSQCRLMHLKFGKQTDKRGMKTLPRPPPPTHDGQKMPHWMLCRYRGLYDPFCCEHRSRDSQRFSVRWATPSRKRHLDQFSRFCTVRQCDRHRHADRHRHTDHATCDICRSRSHLCYACDAAVRAGRLSGVWRSRNSERRDLAELSLSQE